MVCVRAEEPTVQSTLGPDGRADVTNTEEQYRDTVMVVMVTMVRVQIQVSSFMAIVTNI